MCSNTACIRTLRKLDTGIVTHYTPEDDSGNLMLFQETPGRRLDYDCISYLYFGREDSLWGCILEYLLLGNLDIVEARPSLWKLLV
jgi:hypothetical protein